MQSDSTNTRGTNLSTILRGDVQITLENDQVHNDDLPLGNEQDLEDLLTGLDRVLRSVVVSGEMKRILYQFFQMDKLNPFLRRILSKLQEVSKIMDVDDESLLIYIIFGFLCEL